jgi:hypothetical protein
VSLSHVLESCPSVTSLKLHDFNYLCRNKLHAITKKLLASLIKTDSIEEFSVISREQCSLSLIGTLACLPQLKVVQFGTDIHFPLPNQSFSALLQDSFLSLNLLEIVTTIAIAVDLILHLGTLPLLDFRLHCKTPISGNLVEIPPLIKVLGQKFHTSLMHLQLYLGMLAPLRMEEIIPLLAGFQLHELWIDAGGAMIQVDSSTWAKLVGALPILQSLILISHHHQLWHWRRLVSLPGLLALLCPLSPLLCMLHIDCLNTRNANQTY